MNNFDIFYYDQDTPKWHVLRAISIGSSDAPIILGKCPFGGTPNKLWREKKGLEKRESNWTMQRGKNLEGTARDLFEKEMSTLFPPIVTRSLDKPYMIASMDGWDYNTGIGVEIKCGGRNLWDQACDGIIPINYEIQMNHQMIVTQTQHIHYCVFFKGKIMSLVMTRNEKLCNEILEKEEEFYYYLSNNLQFPLKQNDSRIIYADQSLENIIKSYRAQYELIKETQKSLDILKNHLLEFAHEGNTDFYVDGRKFISVKKYERKGAIDIDKFIEDHELNKESLEQYRSASVNFNKINFCSE